MPRFTRIALAVLLTLAGCAGPSRAHKLELRDKLARRDWPGAIADIDAGKDSEYGKRNAILYWLDRAAILHDAGRYDESDHFLDLAERRMEELYTRSVSKAAATVLVMEGAEDYAGQVHERTLLHVLRALNYAYRGQNDEAVVEARKVSAFLAELSDRLGDQRLSYGDDAFAQYLSGLLFEDQGRSDDARISFESARRAYDAYRSQYQLDMPVIDPGLGSPGDGELVFLHYAGTAPRRETRTIQVAWNDAMAVVHESQEAQEDPRVKNALVAGVTANAITVALPIFVQDPFSVIGSEIEVEGQKASTLLMEDVTAIARANLAESLPLIQVKAVARAAVKFLVAKVAEEATRRTYGEGAGFLAGMAGRMAGAATETADTRGWATLPAQFRMARLRLPPGRHAVKVRYLDASGAVVGEEEIRDVEIRTGRRTYVHVRTAG